MKSFMYIWRQKWKIIIVSLLVTAIFFSCSLYRCYYSENMTISLIYPDSEKGKYPDGTRFNIYDMLSDEVLKGTVEAYNEVSTDRISMSDIQNKIVIKENLTTDVLSKVNESRDLGIDYAYFANEFFVSFKPIRKFDFSNSKNYFGILPYVDNKLFMEKFYETYVTYFMEQHAERNIIKGLSNSIDVDEFDYLEITQMYNNQVNMCINYLNGKNAENGSFYSSKTGMTFNDLINAFRNLKTVQVQNLTAFVSSSKLTKNPDEFVNKLRVENELNSLEYSKYKVEADLAKKAMNEYDHTFEENIVVAGISEDEGIYQTRAKTAYDTITKRAHDSGIKAENMYQDILENERLIKEYDSAVLNGDERLRLMGVAENMLSEIKTISSELVETADETVEEYLKTKSSDYVRREVADKSYINFGVAVKCATVFCASVLLMICVLTMKEFGSRSRIKLNIGRKKKTKLVFDRASKRQLSAENRAAFGQKVGRAFGKIRNKLMSNIGSKKPPDGKNGDE